MKKLQNNFTTIEQSKRLLELGVPADSADCSLRRVLTDGGYCETWIVDVFDFIGVPVYDDYLPCWSVGRLIEIYDITINLFPGMDLRLSEMTVGKHNESYIEKLVYLFECAAEDGMIDFEELEEEK